MPDRYEIQLGLSHQPTRRVFGPGRKRMLVLGNFSGAASPTVPLQGRPVHRVDIDNLDQLIRQIKPRLQLPLGTLAFTQLDDFHPDHLFASLPVFQALRQARANPSAGHDELLGRLMGRPTSATPANATAQAPATGLDALIHNIVAPHIVNDTSAQTRAFLAAIDAATTEQMRQLLHDPAYLALESAWRGVHWLATNLELDEHLELHLVDVSLQELLDDIAATQGELSGSSLYQRLCGPPATPAQEPRWDLLVGLYGFGPSVQELQALAALGMVASQLGGAFIGAAKPALFGCAALADLPDPTRWNPLNGPSASYWAALRASDIAPSIGLVAPRVLLRLPYGKATDPITQFAFEEQGPTPDHETLLWGPGSLTLALMLGRSLVDGAADGASALELDGELSDLPAYTFRRDGQVELQPCAEALLGERAGQALLALGLMPLLSHRQQASVRLMRLQSIAEPPCTLATLNLA